MKERMIDSEITLVPYYPNYDVTLEWYQDMLVGDVSLKDNGEVAIVICKQYQNRHIGRKCILEMVKLAKEQGILQVKANIYSFNTQSRKMFTAIGFKQIDEEWFALEIAKEHKNIKLTEEN